MVCDVNCETKVVSYFTTFLVSSVDLCVTIAHPYTLGCTIRILTMFYVLKFISSIVLNHYSHLDVIHSL